MNTAVQITTTVYLLLAGVIASYFAGLFNKKFERQASALTAIIALISAAVFFVPVFPALKQSTCVIKLFGTLEWEVTLLSAIITGTGMLLTIIVAIYSFAYMEHDTGNNKFFPLLILLLLSIFGLNFSTDLFTLYIFFELLAASSFALIAFRKDEWDPVEAGIKFLVMSALGSALIVLAIALIYMNYGLLNMHELASKLTATDMQITIPLICFAIGFGIKAAIFPMHTWLPDAHAEAPSGISAMLSGIVIETGFFVLFRLFITLGIAFPWEKIFIWIALITITAGNIMALTQMKLKRMLAYSSIAQIGYIVLGISIGVLFDIERGIAGGMFHIVTHALMKGLAFLCAGAVIHTIHSSTLEDMRGAGWKMPVTAVTFVIAVMSLAGVPPMAGFMSKLWIYQAGIQSATTLGWAASIVAIINSVISLGYYLPAIGVLYSKEENAKTENISEVHPAMLFSLVILALLIIILGFMPSLVRNCIEYSLAFIRY